MADDGDKGKAFRIHPSDHVLACLRYLERKGTLGKKRPEIALVLMGERIMELQPESDKKTDNDGEGEEAEIELEGDKTPLLRPSKPGKVALMPDERVVFAHELRPNQGFRLLVTGEVDADMVKALEAFAAFQKALVRPGRPPDAQPGKDLAE